MEFKETLKNDSKLYFLLLFSYKYFYLKIWLGEKFGYVRERNRQIFLYAARISTFCIFKVMLQT